MCQTLCMKVGDPDGHGQYGVLDEDEGGCLCAECGWRGVHLGLHAYRAHGLTAAEYKQRHGLRRSKGLVATGTRETLRLNAAIQYPTNVRMRALRDPDEATRARRRLALPLSAEAANERDRRIAALGRASRRGTVVVCTECGVEFCPLVGASRRRFCTRSCASKSNRRKSTPDAAG